MAFKTSEASNGNADAIGEPPLEWVFGPEICVGPRAQAFSAQTFSE